MKTISCQFEYKIYKSIDELLAHDKELMLMAIEELKNAYAPYSNFHVGAAVRLNDQSVYRGSNQENASYPLCMCGERVALYNAATNKPFVPVESLAITIKNLNMIIDKPVSPCGACRQVISEYESRHKQAIRILLKSDNAEVYLINTVNDLLPLGFNASFL